MRNVPYLLGLLFAMALPLIATTDFGEIIRIAQCQSWCLRNLTTDDRCWSVGEHENTECEKCWYTCERMGSFPVKITLRYCSVGIVYGCRSCSIACRFYRTHEIEKDQFEPIKLPAPEQDEIIHTNKHDMAITMHKNLLGVWEMEKNYTANEKIAMKPGNWIIITNENGAIKHYSWEKWYPALQSLKESGPLFQATITWTDWQNQLKMQRKEVSLPYEKVFLELQNRKQKKPSFVVTWQEETGNGIMGNQVADSESAQISLPPGRYLVRIASDDGPGSYPIIIDTKKNKTAEIFNFIAGQAIYISSSIFLSVLMLFHIYLLGKYVYNYLKKQKKKDNEISSTNGSNNNSNDYIWEEVDINANAFIQNANMPNVIVYLQDSNENIQDVTINTQNVTTNDV